MPVVSYRTALKDYTLTAFADGFCGTVTVFVPVTSAAQAAIFFSNLTSFLLVLQIK